MKQPIHLKIFFSFAAMLLLSIVITVLFGNQMMEQLYRNSKTSDLEEAGRQIKAALLERDCDLTLDQELMEALFPIEKNNINVLLLTQNQQQLYINYYSRENWFTDRLRPGTPLDRNNVYQAGKNSPDPFRSSPQYWVEDATAAGVFQTSSLPLVLTTRSDRSGSTLDYYDRLSHEEDTIYIFLRTPQEPITLAASLAVRYNLYLALLSFVLAAALSYFVARRITRPIEQINQATERISRMNFGQQCQIHTGDELESLSHNINDMAVKLQDYIQQLELNQQLLEKDLQREAKTSHLRQEFIANVSHDFKTPLTLIRAYAETLRNQQLSSTEQQQYCDIILEESSRMNRLVTQLLQLSRLESGAIQLELSYFPIEELLREILHHNQLLIQKKQLQIHWDCQPAEHIVQGDYQRIEQALINVLENAIKYTLAGGEILLQIRSQTDQLCRIAITNSCQQPLSEEQLEHLFISFYKADESRHMDQQSFGLGLAIVKATMDLHQQPCSARNTPQGLEIAFTLPLLPEDETEEDDSIEPEA